MPLGNPSLLVEGQVDGSFFEFLLHLRAIIKHLTRVNEMSLCITGGNVRKRRRRKLFILTFGLLLIDLVSGHSSREDESFEEGNRQCGKLFYYKLFNVNIKSEYL